jgi:acetyl-CoA carboxylase alpha subunit
LDYEAAVNALRRILKQALKELAGQTPEETIKERVAKFRNMGNFFSEAPL